MTSLGPDEMHLPRAMQVRDLLRDLLDRPVNVSPTSPLAPGNDTPASVAVYVDDSLRVRALVAFDLALSAYVGAALGLAPPATAKADRRARILSEPLRENLYEVMNVAASLFNVDGTPHVRLYQLHAAGDPLPQDILAHSLTLGRRDDLAVEITGYGSGAASVVLTNT